MVIIQYILKFTFNSIKNDKQLKVFTNPYKRILNINYLIRISFKRYSEEEESWPERIEQRERERERERGRERGGEGDMAKWLIFVQGLKDIWKTITYLRGEL